MTKNLLDTFVGIGASQHACPLRRYFDDLFPPGPQSYFREPNSAPQIVMEHNGVKYVVQRIGKAGIHTLGRYNPDRQPEGENRYAFDPLKEEDKKRFGINFDIDKKIARRSYPPRI